MSSRPFRPNFTMLLLLAWAAVAAWLLAQFWSGVGVSYADPDDAMRLAQVRAFLAGQGWFDLTEMRIDPPHGYLTHWSRLIDAGLAGLYLLFTIVADAAVSERLMQAAWPLLWLLPAMGGVAAIAWRCAGRDAAIVALVLAVFGLPAFQQFRPGRIDHHNVQIALAILTVAACVWSDRIRWTAIAAGALSAFALAIGLESLPWIVLSGAAIVAGFVMSSDARAMQRYGLALAAATAIAFCVSVPPSQWMHSACDAIAINTALPAMAAGLACAASGYLLTDATLRARTLAAGGCALIAVALFVAVDPRCLAGPFALVDAQVRPIWLAQVREMQPLAKFFAQSPALAVWVSAFPIAALASALLLLRARDARRDFGTLTALAAYAVAALTTVAVVKAYSYAMWFGMPLVAAAVVQIARVRALRWLAAAALTPIVVSTSAVALTQAAFTGSSVPPPSRQECFAAASYRPLAALPPGLVVADVDFGPLIVALTPHAVMAAPYHRISAGIVVAHRALAAPPEEAANILRRIGADYLVLCGGEPVTGLAAAPADSLWSRLRAGNIPSWLAPVAGPGVLQAFAIRH